MAIELVSGRHASPGRENRRTAAGSAGLETKPIQTLHPWWRPTRDDERRVGRLRVPRRITGCLPANAKFERNVDYGCGRRQSSKGGFERRGDKEWCLPKLDFSRGMVSDRATSRLHREPRRWRSLPCPAEALAKDHWCNRRGRNGGPQSSSNRR